MTNLITEARELCESKSAEYVYMRMGDIIPELCDALEKAEEKNTQLVRELSALARESVRRDIALAMMEVEVEAVLRETQARESGCVYCINCPEKIIAKKKRYSLAAETGIVYDDIKVNFCPMCGKRLEVGHEGG